MSTSDILDETQLKTLLSKSVCVVGCGGIGGYSIEMLARLGIGNLTVIDGDTICQDNFNRQILATIENQGSFKAYAALRRVKQINPNIRIIAHSCFLNEENAGTLLMGHDVVLDATDSVSSRRLIAEACKKQTIPLIHAGISGWCAQTCIIPPENDLFTLLYTHNDKHASTPCLSFTPSLAAALQVSSTLKLLLGQSSSLENVLFTCDLSIPAFNKIDLGGSK